MPSVLSAHRAVQEAGRRAAFYRAWGAAHGMGSTHAHTMRHLGIESRGDTERVRQYLATSAENRTTLADAVRKAPSGLFEPFEGALLVLGEETGTLDRSLRLLGDWHQGQHRLLTRLWGKSAYPLFLTLVAVLLLPLPVLFQGRTTDYLMRATMGLLIWWFFGGTLVWLPARTSAGRARWVRARLARSIATGMEAGAPVDRVLDMSVDAAASDELKRCVAAVPADRRRAQPLSATLHGCPHVPEELVAAMRVAESSGNWRNTVGRMGELYEEGF